jgi:hypothetical protein
MKPPTIEQWRRAPFHVRWYATFLIWREVHAGLFSMPVSLSIRAGLIGFIILAVMPYPHHPLSPLIASGGGLSCAIIMWRVK